VGKIGGKKGLTFNGNFQGKLTFSDLEGEVHYYD